MTKLKNSVSLAVACLLTAGCASHAPQTTATNSQVNREVASLQIYAQLDDIVETFKGDAEAMKLALKTKPDPAQMKVLLHYFQATPEETAEDKAMLKAAEDLPVSDWLKLMQWAKVQGLQMATLALHPEIEERMAIDKIALPWPASAETALPGLQSGFMNSPGGSFYSAHLPAADKNSAHLPMLIGGGFPFNQTQFTGFNSKLAAIGASDLYDPICTGLAVEYDTAVNGGKGCKPYSPATPLDQLRDEMALRIGLTALYLYLPTSGQTLSQSKQTLFRITRLSFNGISIVDQAHTLRTLAAAQGYGPGESLLTGLSYGGLIAAKAAAMYPGLWKTVVLFSPGTENPAHENLNADLSAVYEPMLRYRRVLIKMVHDIAYSPRYDVYVPVVSKNDNIGFRNSLQKKMLGELDLDIASDLTRIQDRIFIVTGVHDDAIDPQTQIDAMRVIFKRNPQQGTYILVLNGGHALWGNPDQQDENGVIHILTEVQKGDAGALKPGMVYAWDEVKKSFLVLGAGLPGLNRASQLVAKVKTAHK